MRIIQISDFHFTQLTWNPFRLFPKRILGNFNWLWARRKAFAPQQLESLPALFRSLKPDLILFGGDFSTTALSEEFKIAARFVKKCPQPWIAIPGNHDHYTFRSYRGKHFYKFFSNKRKEITHPVEFFTLKDHGIEAHPLSENWNLVALDTALATNPYSSEGLFSEKLEEYLKEVLKLIPENGSILLFNHYPFFQNDVERRNLRRGDALQEIIKQDPRIRLYLHGHSHRHTIADLQPNNLPIILDSGSCALAKKGTWNLIDLTPEGCKVDVYRWNDAWQNTRTEEFVWMRK